MIVSINTQTLNELSQESISVSAEISAAFECLSPVVEHNDWNCYERDAINEMITTIKQFSKELKENAESFSSSLQQTSSSFDELEKKTPAAMQGTQAAFANMLSKKTPVTLISGKNKNLEVKPIDMSRFLRLIPAPSWSPFRHFQIEMLIKPIPVIKPAPFRIIGGQDGINPVLKELSELFEKLGINRTV